MVTKSTTLVPSRAEARTGAAPSRALPGAGEERAAPATAPAPAGPRLRLSAGRLEMLCTGVTLVAMLGGWLAERAGAPGALVAALYALAYVAGGAFGLKGGIEALRERRLDVDLLMVLAALGAWVVEAPFQGAMLLFLFSLSNVLQDYALDRTRNAIRALMRLRPQTARVRRGGDEVTLPIEQVAIGEHVVVRPGDLLPLDGVVVEGEGKVDQAAITGESVPVNKGPGDPVFAGTINQDGSLQIAVTKLARDSTLAKLIALVEEAQSEKARTQAFIERWEPYYAAFVVALTAVAAIVPMAFFAEAFETAFYRAITIMVAASPCALVISTPASLLSGIGNGARRGILFKGGVHLEQSAGIRVVAFDKTGTLTYGKPQLTDVRVFEGDADTLLALAGAVQAHSEHALARATVEAAAERNLRLAEAFAFRSTTGKGVRGSVGDAEIRIGNLRYFEDQLVQNLAEARAEVERLQAEGKTSVLVARLAAGNVARVLGSLAFADALRPDAAAVVRELRAMGLRTVMLTGDNDQVARVIAEQVGVDAYYADLLPEDKVRIVRELRARHGSIAMVGDGVNDAPALATATVGIAMGAAGTDVALETADVVLMADNLTNIPYVIELSRQTRRTLFVNLSFALGAIALMIVSILTLQLPLPLAVLGHEGGTVLVSLNGLRLLLFKRRRAAA